MDMEAVGKWRSHNHQPCAACRMLRRRCDTKCPLSPYFPAHEIHKFAGVHRVFGTSNVIKMIQMVEETQKDDAVKAMVYEAMARLRDPVYGSTGAILQLQKMVQEHKVELESIRASVSEMQEQRDRLLRIHKNLRNLDSIFPNNDDPKFFDGHRGFLSVEVDPNMAFNDPLEFPVEDNWVL